MVAKLLKQGDVVSIPLGDGRVGLAQATAVTAGGSVYLVVFDDVVGPDHLGVDLEAAAALSRIRLAATTNSVLVETGHWKVIGNAPVRDGLPMPAYKVAIARPGNFYVEDWAQSRRRPATAEEAASLPLRSSYSPAAVEGALKAQLGLEPWREAFDAMLPGGPTSQLLFGDT